MGFRKDISNQLHSTLMEGTNTIRGALGLSPKKDYGCVYDRVEAAKKRQIEASYNYYDDDEDDDYQKPYWQLEEEEKAQKDDDDWDW